MKRQTEHQAGEWFPAFPLRDHFHGVALLRTPATTGFLAQHLGSPDPSRVQHCSSGTTSEAERQADESFSVLTLQDITLAQPH